MTEEMDKRDAMDQEEDAVEAETRPMDEEVEEEDTLGPEDIARESERIIRWGAARASVIVMTPFLGSLALMANEVYMITRLCDLRPTILTVHVNAGCRVCAVGQCHTIIRDQAVADGVRAIRLDRAVCHAAVRAVVSVVYNRLHIYPSV